MDIDAPVGWCRQNYLGQQQAVGGDNGNVSLMGHKGCHVVFVFEIQGREDGDVVLLSQRMNGGFLDFFPRLAGRGGWL